MSRRNISRVCAPTVAAGFVALGAMAANAGQVTPASYTFTPGANCGSFCYLDPGFTKLTDGVIGDAGWEVDGAAPWVGWNVGGAGLVNIDFDFGSSKTIDSVSVGSTQDNLGDVVLPSLNIYSSNNDLTWVLAGSLVVPPSDANDRYVFDTGPHVWLDVNSLGIDARYVRVQEVSNGPWAFTDEVRFANGGGAVPEPASWALMIGGFGLAGAALRRRRKIVHA
ncbi:PEPxxWA-CTERM sorting domain-containing protein [Phenylobacterium sp.]|uniref:PEPxxWA-CTERM sorting domain-containing protein n=1 Tax=Phenylobacterium sp. TaxID=1871053 RepID=UPI002CC81745|nr:PEPxxWA-CTERM sorting domain-containing protein [Phenylobacterium sp.]HLZ76839.1 PEPxxWA-CTERM sorting domain-containing protein [Phenylobacterium sp.]